MNRDLPASLDLGMPPERFLAEHWQRAPRFMPQALPAFETPISPDELRELAEDDDLVSRLVTGGKRPGDWNVEFGGFAPSRWKRLPKTHWTLLVSEIDALWADAGRLLGHFDFLPHWRRDDLMVSLAGRGGSVGPHVDAYDVFLLQAHGTRRWQIEWPVAAPPPDERLVPNLPLKILDTFTATEVFDCQPGDLLYLPPGVPHHGVASSDNCMTFSIGFRSPTAMQAVHALVSELRSAAALDRGRFGDAGREICTTAHELNDRDRRALRDWLRATLANADDALIDRALGRLVSRGLVERHDDDHGDASIDDTEGSDHSFDDPFASDPNAGYVEVIEIDDGKERIIARGQETEAYDHWPRDRRLAIDPALRRYWVEHPTCNNDDPLADAPGSRLYIDGHELTSHLRHGAAILERLCTEEQISPREWVERFPDAGAVLERLKRDGRLLEVD